MNQRQLQAFRLVLQHGSITIAAQALHVSQPAVSRLISDLERSIGFSLFRREGGKITPTIEAIEFGREVDHMYFGMERLQQIACDIKELRRASLYVATVPMISFSIMPKAMKNFLADHKGIRMTHHVHTSGRVVDLVSSRQVELGIAHSHINPNNTDVIATFRAYCVCVMRPDHPLALNSVITPALFHNEPFIAVAFQAETASRITRHFADANVQPDVILETQPSYSACGLVAEGLGIAIVDAMTPKVFGNALKILPLEPRISFDLYLIKPRGAVLSKAADKFSQHLIKTLETMDEEYSILEKSK